MTAFACSESSHASDFSAQAYSASSKAAEISAFLAPTLSRDDNMWLFS